MVSLKMHPYWGLAIFQTDLYLVQKHLQFLAVWMLSVALMSDFGAAGEVICKHCSHIMLQYF